MATTYSLIVGETQHRIQIEEHADGTMAFRLDEAAPVAVTLSRIGESRLFELLVDGRPSDIVIERVSGGLTVIIEGQRYAVATRRRRRPAAAAAAPGIRDGELVIRAPMAGSVVEVLVREGDRVAAGDALLVIQAMKMNNEIHAPIAGTVRRLNATVGESVEQNAPLLAIEAGPGAEGAG